jgi:hypothetical protein
MYEYTKKTSDATNRMAPHHAIALTRAGAGREASMVRLVVGFIRIAAVRACAPAIIGA